VFGDIGKLTKLLSHMGEIRQRVGNLQQEAKQMRCQGLAGGGLVRIEVNGALEVLTCAVDPSLVEQQDVELLEDLLRAAMNQALADVRRQHAERLGQALGGIDLPGLREGLSALGGVGPLD
jgi:DNA-binding YbaB/EbfC family protein